MHAAEGGTGQGEERVTVAYVDGDPDRTSRTVDKLAQFGVTVVSATDGLALRTADHDFDCVVVEHDPPVVDGFTILDQLAADETDSPVVFFPSGGDERVAGRAIDAGVDGYVARFEDGDVARLVRRVRGILPDDATDATADSEAVESVRSATVIDETVKDRAMAAAPVGITIADGTRPDEPLVYVNDSFEELTGYDRSTILGRNCRFLQGPDSGPEAVTALREAIETNEPVTVELLNYRADGEPFWNRVDVAPIRDETGMVTHYVGFQTDITKRVRAEERAEARAAEAARERATLDRLVDRIDGVLGDVTMALVEATSREEIQQTVCTRLVASGPYVAAWIGDIDLTVEEIVPAASSGFSPANIPLDSDDPVARAVDQQTHQWVTDLASTESDAISQSAGALAALPLRSREHVDGVLVVYVDGETLDDRETAVLAALARIVGTALDAFRTRRILEADATVEITVSLRDRTLFFVEASEVTGYRLTFAGRGYSPAGDRQLLFSAERPSDDDVSVEELRAVLSDHTGVADVTVVTTTDDGGLLNVTVTEPSLTSLLSDMGVTLESLVSERDSTHLTLALPADGDPRAVVDALDAQYDGTDLQAIRERTRPPRTKQEFLDTLAERLTDRQRIALRNAYVGGYFDQQRGVTGSELADSMDITRSTFHQHLRSAQRKVLNEFFTREDG